MIESLLANTRIALGAATPLLSLLFLTFLTSMPINLPASIHVTPAWTMMGLVFWSINRPELLPLWGIFLVGLLRDGLEGGFIGLSSFLFIVTHEIILLQRRVLLARSFIAAWVAFALAFLIVLLCQWIAFKLAGRHVGLLLVTKQYVVSALLFPLVSYILTALMRLIVVAPNLTIELGGRTL
ncbi:MAG: rod shape-determining protein MreD [Candidatus Symbiobacter sp.]|nr:rod shape-determining protein MreD [Candidatus Symbiobacter sp.]